MQSVFKDSIWIGEAMKVKAGILSMQRICNYGSFLQAYGLKKILEELGCEVQFADYHPGECLVHGKGGAGIPRKIEKFKDVMKVRAPFRDKIRFINYKRNYAKKYYPYLGIDESLRYFPDVDLMVIGSDEVFNCIQDNPNVGFTPDLFGVGQTATKVISYAASFGNTTIEKLETYKVKEKVAGWLGALDVVSVRDSNSGKIVKTLTGRAPEYHFDPVLIYDFMKKCREIPSDVQEKNYLLLYGYTGRFTKRECAAIRKFAEERHLRILCIGGVQHCCDKFVDCNPFSVIAYFQHAKAVITDTFHGTILSVITHQRFVTIVRENGYGNAEKLIDLLEKLNLSKQILKNMSELSCTLGSKIDYSIVDQIIKEERTHTYQYLKEQIDGLHISCNDVSQIGTKCVGCRSCEQICPQGCISMIGNREGFLYPRIDETKCKKCGICMVHCPVNTENKDLNNPIRAYGLKNKDRERILRSASGGASDLFAQYIIAKGGTVFGCAYTETLEVQHIPIYKQADLYKIQSSKYVQSDIGNCYSQAKKILDEGRRVLFTGTPCQIAGLYAYLGKTEYSNLYTMDLICHGVPSPLFFQKYLEYMSKKLNGRILSYNFRSKDKRGWGTQYLIKTKTKTKTKTLALDKYGKHFMDGDCYRECCYQCKYANLSRVGDITVGDFWGIIKCYPDFFSEKGVSSVLVNTAKGEFLINQITDKAEIIFCTLEDVLIKQGNLIRPTQRKCDRDTFYVGIHNDDFLEQLKVGVCLKDRLKSMIPQEVIFMLKK